MAGRPSLISYEDVAKVCADLDSRGLCTIENVHRQLGNVGSRTTVHKHYQTWRAQLRAAAAQPFNATFSEALRLALVREIETATANARTELEGRVADLQEQLQSALGNLQEAEDSNGAIAAELEAAKVAAQEADRAHLEATAERQGRIDELEGQVQTLNDKLDREIASGEASRLEAAKASNQLEIAKKDVEHFSSQHAQLLGEVKAQQAKAADADKRAAVATAGEAHHKEKLDVVQKDLLARIAAADAAHKALSEQLGAVKATAAAAERAHIERQGRVGELEKQLKALDEKLAHESQERHRLQGEVKSLNDADKRAAVAEANERHLVDKTKLATTDLDAARKRIEQLEQQLDKAQTTKGKST